MSTDELTGVVTATIAASASESNEIQLADNTMAGLIMPAAWTAAVITFLVSDRVSDRMVPRGTWVPLYTNDGTEVSLTVAASTAVAITGALADALAPWTHIKLRSGTAASPVTQDAARTIYVVTKA